jgi:hypothetical protein
MLRLTDPRSHSLEELRALYDEFKVHSPDCFSLWKSVELHFRQLKGGEADEASEKMTPVAIAIFDFLKARTEWESMGALILAFIDFRVLMSKDLQSVIPVR